MVCPFTKNVIILLKKGGRHVWKELDDKRSITLLNTELKIWAQVLTNLLQLVINDLIGPAQNYAMKGRSIPVRSGSRDPRGVKRRH